MKKITEELIHEFQQEWAGYILKIGRAYQNKEDYKSIAGEFISKYYGYNEGLVLFKPTLASVEQFRDTYEKALSYFISGNPDYPEDQGFAIQPWKQIRFQNVGIVITERRAVAMGNYYFTREKENVIKVEYTFGYFITPNDEIKIYLHHSSIPYTSA